ncbi:hypothetical protein E4U42_000837 [Claviceps africana]|uniref:Major facilitator superfamily transporter n=1 Tax=Claviceps africana TaxID=83212 RepID=A0A8K0J262_9HYPO|nr:hypothetical protein E4U42_000837 [Claviceps africana]
MSRQWSLKRPGDIISRPLPVHSPRSPDFTFFPRIYPHTGDSDIPKSSMTGSSVSGRAKFIKYGSGKHAGIELVPQPSDDFNDPLNWPRWRKDLNFVSLLVMVGLVGSTKTAFIPTVGSLSSHYRVSNTSIAALTAVPLMVSAMTGMISSIVAKTWGKRPVYLTAALLLFIGTMWNMTAGDSYVSCLGSRIFQGLGWGAFDVLVNGSVQDTYFEHERGLPVTIYNIFTITTTWGSPLLGGLVSRNADSFTNVFRVTNCFFLLAFPLLAFAAPETSFDRSGASLTPLPTPGLDAWRPWRFRHRVNRTSILRYLKKMRPVSFQDPMTLSMILQAPRALIAPTTCLLFILTCVPFGALWGLTTSISILTSPAPLSLNVPLTGVLMTGPWVVASLCVGGFSFYRGLHERFTQSVSSLILSTGTSLILIGLLSYGLGVHNFMSSHPSSSSPMFSPVAAGQVSLQLLSLQLGILAGGSYILDATVRPFIARSASFTSSSIAIAQRSIIDMQSGVIVLRNLAAGIFVLALPHAVAVYGGLKAVVIGLATTQILLTGATMTTWWLYDESVWKADGITMGLIDLGLVKESTSFFETD